MSSRYGSLQYAVFPDPSEFLAGVVHEDSMAIGLPILEIAHPSASPEVGYSLSLSSVLHEVTFILLPVIPLHSNKSMVRFVFLIDMPNYPGIPVVLGTPAMELAGLKLPFISDLLFIPVQLPIAFHLALHPIAQVQLTIVVLVVALALPVGLGLHGARAKGFFAIADIAAVLVLVEMPLLGYDAFVVVGNSALSVV